jgi:hypothetical protein
MKIVLSFLCFCFLACASVVAQNNVDYGLSKDTVGVTKKVEVEAKFANAYSWQHFLQRNLRMPDSYMSSLPKTKTDSLITQSVEVQFIVCTDGTLCELKVLNDAHPALVQESLRVIKKSSGMWEAAMQDGKKVKAYHRQKITYVAATNQ